MSPTVLIVSPFFPPSALAGVHRARHLAKHLPAHGWRPIVVRVNERFYAEPSDPELAALVPASVDQVGVGAVSTRVGRLFGVGDVGLRGYFSIRSAIERLAGEIRPNALLITGSPYYPMLLAGWARRRLIIPVVLDFQDPWVSAEGATHPRWSKRGVAHRLALALEPRAVRHANFITSVSEQQNAEMAARYPWLCRENMAAIPIGGDPEDFNALRDQKPTQSPAMLGTNCINVSYVGTVLPRAGLLVRTVFRALARLRGTNSDLASKIRFNFIGTSNQPYGYGKHRVRALAEEEGISDLLLETPERIPFLAALNVLANSQGLLLLGSDEPHYTASKIYPALMSGRPYVSLFHRASSAHTILRMAGGGRAFAFSDVSELPSLEPALEQALFAMATRPAEFGRVDPLAYEPFTARNVAGAFARVLDSVQRD